MGRRPSVSTTEREFRKRFASELLEAIGSSRGAQTRAAQQLGVKRQTVSLYLKGKTTPGGDVVQRAWEIWGVPHEYGGMPVNSSSFSPRPKPRTEPRQLTLFSDDRQLEVHVTRKSVNSLDIRVSIDFARAVNS